MMSTFVLELSTDRAALHGAIHHQQLLLDVVRDSMREQASRDVVLLLCNVVVLGPGLAVERRGKYRNDQDQSARTPHLAYCCVLR